MFPIGILSLHAPADECGFAVGAAGAEDHHFRLFTCEYDAACVAWIGRLEAIAGKSV
jgi:hypothetical protein